MKKIFRMPSVLAQTGLSRSSIYALMREGKFPKPIPLGGPRAVGWREEDLEEWAAKQYDKMLAGRGITVTYLNAAAAHDSRDEVAHAA